VTVGAAAGGACFAHAIGAVAISSATHAEQRNRFELFANRFDLAAGILTESRGPKGAKRADGA
jgi:hypothetical protein